MACSFRPLARIAVSSVFLFALNLSIASAGDHTRREPTMSHWPWKSGRYTRETNHGLIYYPCVTYWASGDLANSVDRWDSSDMPNQVAVDIAPGPRNAGRLLLRRGRTESAG